MVARWLSQSMLLLAIASAGIAIFAKNLNSDLRPAFFMASELERILADQGTGLDQVHGRMLFHSVRQLETLGGLDELTAPVTLPFDYMGGHILIAAEIEPLGVSKTLIIDSGMRSTLLDRDLEVPLAKTFQVDPAVTYGLVDQMHLAEANFHHVSTFVTDFSAPGQPLYCLSDSGVIGASLMRHATWQIDYQARTLTVAQSVKELDHVADAIAVPFTLVNLSPAIALKIGENLPVQVLVDTGWSGGIHLTYPDFLTLDAAQLEAKSTSEGLVETLRGLAIVNQNVMQAPTLSLGDLTLEDFPILVSEGTNAHPYSLLGNEFLEHFIVTLDWSTHRLYLKPVSLISEMYPKVPDYGFQAVIHGGHLLVAGLHYPSPAASAGLQIGDRILAIDDDAYTALGDEQACAFVLSPVGDRYSGPISITVERRGQLLTYTVTPESLAPEATTVMSSTD